jgi:hypothetical protein
LKGFDIIGFEDTFCTAYGWHRDLKRAYGLSPEHIAARCKKVIGLIISNEGSVDYEEI